MCDLSPVLFSLYINGLVKRLHAEKCGVQCGDHLVPGLLFADDTTFVASYKARLKKSLDILIMWCDKWGVKITAYEDENGGEM